MQKRPWLALIPYLVIAIAVVGCSASYNAKVGNGPSVATPVPAATTAPMQPIIIQQRDAQAEVAAWQQGRSQGEQAGSLTGVLIGALAVLFVGIIVGSVVWTLSRSRAAEPAAQSASVQPAQIAGRISYPMQPPPAFTIAPPPVAAMPNQPQWPQIGRPTMALAVQPVPPVTVQQPAQATSRQFYAMAPNGAISALPGSQGFQLHMAAGIIERTLASYGYPLPVLGERLQGGLVEFLLPPMSDIGGVVALQSALATQLQVPLAVGMTSDGYLAVSVFEGGAA